MSSDVDMSNKKNRQPILAARFICLYDEGEAKLDEWVNTINRSLTYSPHLAQGPACLYPIFQAIRIDRTELYCLRERQEELHVCASSEIYHLKNGH